MSIDKINAVSVKRFGYDASQIGPTAALWLAQHILDTTGKNVIKRITRYRDKHGRGTPHPEYGTELFNGF